MGEIEKKVIETIDNQSKKFEDNSVIQQYSEASKEFEDLVKKGYAKHRGNNLLSAENFHLERYRFNSR